VDVGEALSLCQALQGLVGLEFDNYDFSMDSKIVVDVFIGNNNSNINFGCIICHCKQMCNTFYEHLGRVQMEVNRWIVHELT